VISDTSPVRALGNLGLLNLLQQLYDEVIIPRAVAVELSQPRGGQFVMSLDDLAEFSYLKVQAVSESSELERFLVELDPGESEALALAIELRADLILIDELVGRAVARREGLEVIGVLGVLLEAKHRGIIESVSPLLDQLQNKYQFFIGEQLRRQVLRSAGE
jgi:predicted nucleic acid-binding protein